MDEEILQDFLVEASELVDTLGEQLVELENSPTDKELLNAVFRGFHTIKGGAGFLGVTPLVQVCHRAENVFDKIRNGEVAYDATVSDAILRAHDIISDSIQALNDGERELPANDDAFLAELDALLKQGSTEEEPATVSEGDVELALPEGVDPDGDMTDEEFEALLNQRESSTSTGSSSDSEVKLSLGDDVDPDGDMTDEEFEALLNQRESIEQELSTAEGSTEQPEPEPVIETPIVPIKKSAPGGESKAAAKNTTETTVRVDTRRLDEIMNLVGELVLVRNRLITLRTGGGSEEDLSNAVGNLDHVTTDLQASVMKTRMQPVKKVFGRFPRVVRDLSRQLGKKIDLVLEGEDTDLDKNLVEALADPLVHLVRNSVDHGIEMPDVRVAAGKPETGTVVLAAKQEGDHILLSITDDGKGMDPDMLRRKAVEKGMMDEISAAQLDDSAAFQLIMAAGFSTAEVISDISGRGVGMDVVKSMITKLNGSIDIQSEVGKGTLIIIKVPLTLAILPTLMVSFGNDSYAIPLTSVQEIFDYNADHINNIDGLKMVRLREKSIPLHFLTDWLAPDAMKEDFSGDKVVIVSVGNQRVGLVVDQVDGQEEVVIKPLGVMMKHIEGYAGATITGNGNISLILDLPGLMQRF